MFDIKRKQLGHKYPGKRSSGSSPYLIAKTAFPCRKLVIYKKYKEKKYKKRKNISGAYNKNRLFRYKIIIKYQYFYYSVAENVKHHNHKTEHKKNKCVYYTE